MPKLPLAGCCIRFSNNDVSPVKLAEQPVCAVDTPRMLRDARIRVVRSSASPMASKASIELS